MKILNKLKKHQFLFEELVKRDFKKKYKGSVLGMGWSLLQPLLTLLVMKLVFTHFFGRNTPHYIIYLFAGSLIFTYFSEATKGGMRTLLNNAKIFAKVTVPKYLFLLSKNIQALISFLLTLVLFFAFVAFDHLPFTWKFLTLLYPIILLVLFNIGMGLILSAMYVFFRDVQYLYDVFCRLLSYTSAIFYTVDSFSEKVQHIFFINPIYTFIYYFRSVVIHGFIPSYKVHLILAGYVIVVLALGCWMYKGLNKKFLYYI